MTRKIERKEIVVEEKEIQLRAMVVYISACYAAVAWTNSLLRGALKDYAASEEVKASIVQEFVVLFWYWITQEAKESLEKDAAEAELFNRSITLLFDAEFEFTDKEHITAAQYSCLSGDVEEATEFGKKMCSLLGIENKEMVYVVNYGMPLWVKGIREVTKNILSLPREKVQQIFDDIKTTTGTMGTQHAS